MLASFQSSIVARATPAAPTAHNSVAASSRARRPRSAFNIPCMTTSPSLISRRGLQRFGCVDARRQFAVTGMFAVDDRHGAGTLPEQLLAFLADTRAACCTALRLKAWILATGEGFDFLRDAHTAPIVAAHGAEIGVD